MAPTLNELRASPSAPEQTINQSTIDWSDTSFRTSIRVGGQEGSQQSGLQSVYGGALQRGAAITDQFDAALANSTPLLVWSCQTIGIERRLTVFRSRAAETHRSDEVHGPLQEQRS